MKKDIKDLAKAERRAYYKAWRRANPSKVRKHQETYWTRKAEQRLKSKAKNESLITTTQYSDDNKTE